MGKHPRKGMFSVTEVFMEYNGDYPIRLFNLCEGVWLDRFYLESSQTCNQNIFLIELAIFVQQLINKPQYNN